MTTVPKLTSGSVSPHTTTPALTSEPVSPP